MLVLDTPVANRCEDFNCLVLDLPDGSRVRVWLTRGSKRRNKLRCVIDAPHSVVVTRGKLLGDAARGPEVMRRVTPDRESTAAESGA